MYSEQIRIWSHVVVVRLKVTQIRLGKVRKRNFGPVAFKRPKVELGTKVTMTPIHPVLIMFRQVFNPLKSKEQVNLVFYLKLPDFQKNT